MSNLIEKKFNNEELGIELESYIDEECCIWFKAKEVAQILGYKNTEKAIKSHVSENHKRKILFSCQCETHGQVQGRWIIFIDEPGFYELVFRSRLPKAKIFREWIFTKVLPSLRKFGYYKIIESKRKRVIFEGKKYYKHPVFYNYAADKNGDVLSLKTNKIIKMSKNKSSNGYLIFNIYNEKLEKPYTYLHHRFVYEVFKGPIPKCLEVDHLNNLKTDNRIKNLQLLTRTQNNQKSHNKPIKSISITTGEEKRFVSITKAGIELDISKKNISDICCKRKHHKTAKSKKDGCKYTFKFLD